MHSLKIGAGATLAAIAALIGLAAASPAPAAPLPASAHAKTASAPRAHRSKTASKWRVHKTTAHTATRRPLRLTASAGPISPANERRADLGQPYRFTNDPSGVTRGSIHYDNTPAGIPDGVSTIGVSKKF
jgi:hypothetical protein